MEERCTTVGHALELCLHCLTHLRLIVDGEERGLGKVGAVSMVVDADVITRNMALMDYHDHYLSGARSAGVKLRDGFDGIGSWNRRRCIYAIWVD